MTSLSNSLPYLFGKFDKYSNIVLLYLWSKKYYVFAFLLFLSLVLSISSISRTYLTKKVVIYTATSTGSSTEWGNAILNNFQPHEMPWFFTYELDVRPSNGLAENREKVSESKKNEIIIGFDQDGFNPPSNIRTLLPLNSLYLHILVRKKDKEYCKLKRDEDIKKNSRNSETRLKLLEDKRVTLSEFIKHQKTRYSLINSVEKFLNFKDFQKKSVMLGYYGPKGSGTRLVAEQILKHYGTKISDSDIGSHLEWSVAYEMLDRGEIDIIFDSSDIGSAAMRERAKDDKYSLISLDSVEGLVVGQENLRSATIPSNSYAYMNGFCDHDIDTICTRRLLVCSELLSGTDAYYIASGIRQALRQKLPNIEWGKYETTMPTTSLIVPLHQGSIDLIKERTPWWWRWLIENWYIPLIIVVAFLSWRAQKKEANKDPVVLLNHSSVTLPLNTVDFQLKFGVLDAETPAKNLSVTYATDNSDLFPDGSIKISGDGSERIIILTPAKNVSGVANVSIIVRDPDGGIKKAEFRVLVTDDSKLLISTTRLLSDNIRQDVRDLYYQSVALSHRLMRVENSATKQQYDKYRSDLQDLINSFNAMPKDTKKGYKDIVNQIKHNIKSIEYELQRIEQYMLNV